MNKKLLTIIICVIASILFISLGYFIGYYNGVNKAVLFEKMISASNAFHTIKYIENKQFIKALELNKLTVESDMAAIHDISNNELNLIKMPARLHEYQELFNVDYMEQFKILENNIKTYDTRIKK